MDLKCALWADTDMVEPTEEILPMIYRRFKSLDEAIPLIKGELK